MKKPAIALIILAFFPLLTMSCQAPATEPEEEEPKEEVELKPFKFVRVIEQDWVFEGKPVLTVQVENPNSQAVTAEAKVAVSKDTDKSLFTLEQSVEIPANSKENVSFTVEEKMEPGFYNVKFTVNKKTAAKFCFGVSPFDIVSAPDKQPDFDEFWDTAKKQLAGIEMNAELTEIPSKSTPQQKVYLVEMQSVPDGLDGEPVIIRGYYLEPQGDQKYPVLMHFYGYDTLNKPASVYCPSGSINPKYAEFYLSHRGQYINHRTADKREPDGKGDFVNTYGDWFAFEFGHKDSYYYRGAFMDCVQAVRFMASRPTSDMNNLFGEGSSQGGALSYAVAALSDYPFNAIAPCVAFLGDYPDYFQIVSWPADVAKNNKGSMTDEEMYAFLSYFDTKNLATRINCGVIACSGLQDGTCPPHTNLAPFNNLPGTDKEYYFYPEMQHQIPGNWAKLYTAFFNAHMK